MEKTNNSQNNFFILNSGEELKSVKELATAFENMHPDVFFHHANENKNDFANWVDDVFKEKELATELSLKHNSKDSQIAVLKHLVEKHIKE